MPLRSGSSSPVVGSNISEMMNSNTFGAGKPKPKRHQMAIAAALSKARRGKAKPKQKKGPSARYQAALDIAMGKK